MRANEHELPNDNSVEVKFNKLVDEVIIITDSFYRELKFIKFMNKLLTVGFIAIAITLIVKG